MSRTRGFTVIELLTVIALISLLIAIAQPMLTTSAARTYEYDCESHLRQIGVAMNAYAQDYGAFPARLKQADNLLQDKNLLHCPKLNREYYYVRPPSDADRSAVIASCVNPKTHTGHLPHRSGTAYLSLTAGGAITRVTR